METKIEEYAKAIIPAVKGIWQAMGPTTNPANRTMARTIFYETAELVVNAMTLQREGEFKMFDPDQRREIVEKAVAIITKKEKKK